MQELPVAAERHQRALLGDHRLQPEHCKRLRRSDTGMGSYREHALEGASAVDLVVALYDGIIRFLYAAIAAVERGDADGRRAAVKRALDIIIHLQARLRMDVGGRPAQSLSEFYAAIFAQILQASQSASKTQVRARHRLCAECARRVAAGGQGSRCQSRLRSGRCRSACAPNRRNRRLRRQCRLRDSSWTA